MRPTETAQWLATLPRLGGLESPVEIWPTDPNREEPTVFRRLHLGYACATLTTIGSHKIEAELGRGGMGVVYLARDTRWDRQVAIKVLPEQLADDPDRLARFEREAKIVASLNQPKE